MQDRFEQIRIPRVSTLRWALAGGLLIAATMPGPGPAWAGPPFAETPTALDGEPAGPPAGLGALPEGVLFDSIRFHVGGADSFTSQHHTDLPLPDASGRHLESFGADDFQVDGAGWRIDQVEVKGHYFNGDGPAESINVYFFRDAGGAPNAVDIPAGAVAAYENLPFVDGVPAQGDLLIPLVDAGGDPAPVELGAGTYWLIVQANLPIGQSQWGWTAIESSPGSGEGLGSRSVWMQNFPGFGPPCVEAWGDRITDCDLPGTMSPPHPDFGFLLRGERQSIVAEVPTLSFPALLGLIGLLTLLAFQRLARARC